ncbi:hypothetical protein [Secundilactobacillus collinoides]|uniref:hypothetical protein n=1 Tax=Secundilactobacillus collinoides TaxID=33960 RepID=UPI0006D05C32|nr:hypothetical protein [Secundilactobacillus collinoides]
MKKTFLIKGILTLIATIGIGVGFGAVQHPQTAQASTKFSQSELQGPTGYFKSAKEDMPFAGQKSKSATAVIFGQLLWATLRHRN